MKSIKRYYQFLGKYKWRLLTFSAVAAAGVAIETARPYWLKLILENAQAFNTEGAFVYFLFFGASIIGGNWIASLSYFLGDRVIIPLAREIRETVFQKVMELDFAYHVDKNTGSLISAFRRGDGAVFSMFDNIHNELFRVLISLIVTLVFLYQVSPIMSGILILLCLINLVLIWGLISINLKVRTEFNDAEDNVSGVISDSMINYETVKFFAAERKERGRLSGKFDTWSRKLWNFSNSFRLMDVSISLTSGTGMLYILWLAVSNTGKTLGVGDMVMVAGFITGFYWQFFHLFFRIREIAKHVTDLNKYLGILDQEAEVKDPKKPLNLKSVEGKIEFKKVAFVYPKNKEKVLDGIDLVINPGERVAFVGRSGAGKTTLTKLLLRFYDPSKGVIKLDDVDIKSITKSELRKHMGVVPQEPIMFNNTIKFNLSYGKESATTEEINEAARKANILEFVEKLPNAWDTQVGERGIKLSGGQKQRLAIARALLADPEVLIFDEATSNLDSESERKIQMALDEAGKNRTVIIIAHRLSTIRSADKIVVLSAGTISEMGKHEELVSQNGIYKKLWELQSKGKYEEKEEVRANQTIE